MKTIFALLIPLLPTVTMGKKLNLRGVIQQDARSIMHLPDCYTYTQAYGYFGHNAVIHCTSNSNCPGQKCLVEQPSGLLFFCGDPVVWDQDVPLCD